MPMLSAAVQVLRFRCNARQHAGCRAPACTTASAWEAVLASQAPSAAGGGAHLPQLPARAVILQVDVGGDAGAGLGAAEVLPAGGVAAGQGDQVHCVGAGLHIFIVHQCLGLLVALSR